jgi:hypothetical protein
MLIEPTNKELRDFLIAFMREQASKVNTHFKTYWLAKDVGYDIEFSVNHANMDEIVAALKSKYRIERPPTEQDIMENSNRILSHYVEMTEDELHESMGAMFYMGKYSQRD